MTLADSLQLALVLDDGIVKTRDQAIEAMLGQLAASGIIPAGLADPLCESIARRDELGPTGIGEGVAIPHAWHRGLDGMAAALAVSRAGLVYPSLDGLPVHIVLLVLTQPTVECEAAKRQVFDLWLPRLREPGFTPSLVMAATAGELQARIHAADQATS